MIIALQVIASLAFGLFFIGASLYPRSRRWGRAYMAGCVVSLIAFLFLSLAIIIMEKL